MAKETLEPVPVIINNLDTLEGTIKNSSDSIRLSSVNIFNLLNGQEYKKKISDIEKNTEVLSDIKKSLEALSSKSSSTISPDSSYKNIDPQELKNILNQILQSVQNLRNTGTSNVNTSSTSTTNQPPSTSPTQQESITKQQTESYKQSVNNARESLERVLREQQREIKSQRDSYENALGVIEEGQQRQSSLMDTLSNIGKNFLNLFTTNFRKVFDTWDRQIATLKETGMGAQNAVALNRMTKQTMNAAEETLGWNISIEKAIRATNSMLAAGQNPRYIRENNKQLIMGLEGVGLNLSPNTVKAMGQSVFDASQVKEITQGWASLISSDTENALNKEEVSSWLNSDDFKKAISVMMMDGRTTYAEVQQEVIKQATEAVKGGLSGKTALDAALFSAQKNLGYGAQAVFSDNIGSLIGLTQAAGTFTGGGNLASDLSEAVKKSKVDPMLAKQIAQINAGLAMSGDYTALENFMFNDAHTRHIATTTEIEQGQYEGLIPRIAKSIAGHLPAESLGGMSQRLTGDSGFLTTQAFDLVGALGKSSFEVGKLTLLRKIATNTGPEGSLFKNLLGSGGSGGGSVTGSSGGALGKIGGLLGKAGPIALGVAAVGVTAGLVYSAYEEGSQAKEQEKADKVTAEEFYRQEMELQRQYNEARIAGNNALAEDIRKQLDETREKTNQQLDKVTLDQENQSDAWVKGGSTAGGAVGGAVGGAAIGAAIGSAVPLIGTTIGAVVGGLVGGLGGGLGGYFISDAAVKSDLGSPDYVGGRSDLRRELAYQGGHFASGGLVSQEQLALVGEGNNPEMIIPLNNSDRSRSLLATTEQVVGYSDRVTSKYLTSEVLPILRDQSSSIRGILSIISGSSINHFSDGGLIDEEQIALVGEGNNPEVVIPLTKPDKAEELLSKAANNPSTNPEVANMLSSKKGSVADLIIKAAKSMVGVPYKNGGDSFNHPERGLVCNMLVEYAYHTAGLDIKKGTVNDNVYNHRNDWVFTDTPQPGYVIFSNYGERSKYGGTKGYQHMGIMGYGNERIHASSFGKVVINPDYTKGKSLDGTGGVSWELTNRWSDKGNQKPIFAYLRGVDYGSGVTISDESSIIPTNEDFTLPTKDFTLPTISIADFSPFENEIEADKNIETNPRLAEQLRYQHYISDISPEVTILSPDLIKDILYSKGLSNSDSFYDRLALNNPFGLKNIDGSLTEFSSLDVGVQSFISKVERMYDQLADMSYRQQLDFMKDKQYITASEHFHSTQLQADRLARSLDNLNSSVKESNRIASQSSRLPNMTPIPGRRYT